MVVRDLNDKDVYVVTNETSVEHDNWIIDSTNFYQSTPDKDCLSTYKLMRSGTVYLEDNSKC